MKCEDFESNLKDLTREQEMDATVRAQALAHTSSCEACAAQLEAERALSCKLRTLATEMNSAAVPPMRDELLIALRGKRLEMRSPSGARSRPYRAAAIAVAAMFLVVIGVMVMRTRATAPETVGSIPTPTNLPNAKSPERSMAPAPDFVAVGRADQVPTAPTVGRRFTRKRSILSGAVSLAQPVANLPGKSIATTETATNVTQESVPEIATDFMPVGYASPTNMQDGGQLVRVELPRSALVAFGLPMNVNRYDEKVKADVFFGADGVARAIRFVQ
ncbi:MAG: hypothetical protein ABJC10_00915 [Acidobacteriota bacterium]